MNTTKALATIIILLSLVFSLVETHHFGNNLFPQSDSEILADGMACIILAIGLAVHALAASREG